MSEERRRLRLDPERLRRVLTEMGVEQLELARRMGVAQPTVSRWISGKLPPEPATVEAIAQQLGIDTGRIIRRLRVIVPPHLASMALEELVSGDPSVRWDDLETVGDGAVSGVGALQRLRAGEADVSCGFLEVAPADGHVRPVAILATLTRPVRLLAPPELAERLRKGDLAKDHSRAYRVAAAEHTIAKYYLDEVVADFLPFRPERVDPRDARTSGDRIFDLASDWEPYATIFKEKFELEDVLSTDAVDSIAPGAPGYDLMKRVRAQSFEYALYARQDADPENVLELVLRLSSVTNTWNRMSEAARRWRDVPLLKRLRDAGDLYGLQVESSCREEMAHIRYAVRVIPEFLEGFVPRS